MEKKFLPLVVNPFTSAYGTLAALHTNTLDLGFRFFNLNKRMGKTDREKNASHSISNLDLAANNRDRDRDREREREIEREREREGEGEGKRERKEEPLAGV